MSVQQQLYICQTCNCCLTVDEFHGHECNENNTSPMTEHFVPSVKPQSEDSVMEVLIGLVQNRRPLWDHRLPISQRGKSEKDKLWSEIWKEMGGILTMENLQKKWKNLRDQFIKTKAIVETYVPSGSETQHKRKVWKHYENLKFLMDTVQPNQTSSNLKINSMPRSPLSLNISDDCSVSVSDQPSPASSIGAKKRKNKVLKVLDKPIQLPAPAPQQQVSPSMIMASSLLEKLPMKVRMRAERDFINTLYDLVEEHVDE